MRYDHITVPPEVLRQLKMVLSEIDILRLPPSALEDATHGFAADASVFDEPDGDDFHDMLHLNEEEKKPKHWRERLETENWMFAV